MDEDNAEAVLEEKEALKLQRQMAEQLDDADFGLDIFQVVYSVSGCLLNALNMQVMMLILC